MSATTEAAAPEEAALITLLSASGTEGRGASLSRSDVTEVHRLATALEEQQQGSGDSNDSPLLPGRWRLLYQGKPAGEKTEFFSADSWRKYLLEDGPSPIQNLVSGSSGVSRLYQVLQLGEDVAGGRGGRLLNIIDASPASIVAIEALLENKPQPNRLGFRFSGGTVLLPTIWNGTISLPYPVPFALLGDNAKGWLQTDYLTPALRLSRGNKGSLFVLTPEPAPDDPELEALLDPPPPSRSPADPSSLTRNPVLVCPAQFGMPDDYSEFVEALEARGHPAAVAPLRFTDWLRLVPSSFTAEYWKGELEPDVVLPFYYEAIEKGVADLQAKYPGKKIQLVAHSIGGWIARAYLGQLPEERRSSTFSALVTLGTPHRPPPEGFFRTIDQTRGLLGYVEERFPGAYHPELQYMSVCSTAQRGALPWQQGAGAPQARTIALTSYGSLCGDGFTEGDGITPISCGHLPGAEHRDVDAYHMNFVPLSGVRLLGTPWYGSPDILGGWADFLE